MKMIFAIRDRLTNDTPALQLFSHPAAAVRFFSEVARTPNTMVNNHVKDFELVALGILDDQLDEVLTINPDGYPRVIITGEQWAASQQETSTQETK